MSAACPKVLSSAFNACLAACAMYNGLLIARVRAVGLRRTPAAIIACLCVYCVCVGVCVCVCVCVCVYQEKETPVTLCFYLICVLYKQLLKSITFCKLLIS